MFCAWLEKLLRALDVLLKLLERGVWQARQICAWLMSICASF
jgi:hypothetical protein